VVVLAPVIDIPFQLGHYAVNEYNLMFMFMVFGRMFFQFVRVSHFFQSQVSAAEHLLLSWRKDFLEKFGS